MNDFVVIAGSKDRNGHIYSIRLLGCYNNLEQAYGKAYMYLSEIEYTIDAPLELEGKTGFEIVGRRNGERDSHFVWILFND